MSTLDADSFVLGSEIFFRIAYSLDEGFGQQG